MLCDYCGNCVGIGRSGKPDQHEEPISFWCAKETPMRLLGRRPVWTGRPPGWCRELHKKTYAQGAENNE